MVSFPQISLPPHRGVSRHSPAVPRTVAPSLKGVTVLFVDDNEDERELFSLIFAAYGAHVATAASAAEALALYSQLSPDILVSDIAMPHEDGYSLLRKVRALDAQSGKKTPAIAVTGWARAEDRREAFAVGFEVHVAKPVNPAELAHLVARLAKIKQT